MSRHLIDNPVAENSPQPLHQQVCERLIREIAAGHLTDGEKLPPERVHAERMGVAVGTLRKALAELASKGLLERIQGSGNYIRVGNITAALLSTVYSLFRLELHQGGGLPSAEILSVELAPKPSQMLGFGDSSNAHRIRRIRYLDEQPAALEEIWLEAAYADLIDKDDLGDSLYLYYRDVLDIHVLKAKDSVGVATLPSWTPENYPGESGSVCGFVERFSWSHDSQPVEFSFTWFDSSSVRYVANLG